MGDVGVGFVDILPRTDKFVSSLSAQMNKGLGTVSSQASTTSKVLSGVSTGFIALGAAAVAGIAKAVESTVEWSREVLTLQRVTGQSAESASALLAVMGEFGLTAQQATVGLGIFDKNIINNSSNLLKYGIATKDAQGNLLPFDTILANAADKFVSLGNAQKQAAFVMNVFGRSGKALIPILRQGSAGLEQLKQAAADTGLVIGQDTVNAAVELGHQQRLLGESFKGLAVTIGTQFLPIATDFIGWLNDAVELIGKIPGPVFQGVFAFTALAGIGAALIKVGTGIVAAWSGVVSGLIGLGATEAATVDPTVTLTGAIVTLTEALGTQVGVSTTAAEGLAGYGATETGLIVPTETLASAQKDLAASTTAANEAAAGGAAAGTGFLAFLARIGAAALGAAKGLGVFAAAYALGSISATPQISDQEKFNQLLGDARNDFLNLKAGVETYNSSLISGSAATKQHIAFLREQAVALGANGRAFDYATTHGVTYDQALTDISNKTKDAGNAQKTFAQTLTTAFSSIDSGTALLGEVTHGVELLGGQLLIAQRGLSSFATASGTDVKQIIGAITQVVTDPTKTIDDSIAAYETGIASLIQANKQWHASIVSAFGGAGSALDKFANKSNFDFSNAIGSLQKYTGQIKSFGSDISTIQDRFGKKANAFIQWASTQGLTQSGLVEKVAHSNQKMGDSFITQFNRANAATDTLASQIQKALAPVFDKFIQQLKNVVNQLAIAANEVPPFKIKADTSEAKASVASFVSGIPKDVFITVHAQNLKTATGATGGYVSTAGIGFAAGGSTDTIPAMLSPGEFIFRKSAVDRIGVPALRAMNAGGAVTQIAKPQKIEGAMRISDWRNGLASLDAELVWEDTVRTR